MQYETSNEGRRLASFNTASGMDCMQYKHTGNVMISRHCFNTASGIDCMQCLSLPHAEHMESSFNTASGMDCMQCVWWHWIKFLRCVSIPQAVWIACNESFLAGSLDEAAAGFNIASGIDCMQSRKTTSLEKVISMFQHRKRYGLHAILSHLIFS